MKRSLLIAALCCSSSAAVAQVVTTRDGAVQQALQNTVCASLTRRGIGCDTTQGLATLARAREAVVSATNSGNSYPNEGVSTPNFLQTIRGLAASLPWPFKIGRTADGLDEKGWTRMGTVAPAGAQCIDNRAQWDTTSPPDYWCKGKFEGGGGTFVGAGADGFWDCGNFTFALDAWGRFIIPSYPLAVGMPIPIDGKYFHSGSNAMGHSRESTMRRIVHLMNMERIPQRWWGIISPHKPGAAHIGRISTVSMRDSAGIAYSPQEDEIVTSSELTHWSGPDTGSTELHKPCPMTDGAGANLHPYGRKGDDSVWEYHIHNCVLYSPDPSLSKSGYAINDTASIGWEGWPNNLPEYLRRCALDPGFLAKMSDALLKKASQTPGYDLSLIPL